MNLREYKYKVELEKFNILQYKLIEYLDNLFSKRLYTYDQLEVINKYLDGYIGIELMNLNQLELDLTKIPNANNSSILFAITEIRSFIKENRKDILLVYQKGDSKEIFTYWINSIVLLFDRFFDNVDYEFCEIFYNRLINNLEDFANNHVSIIKETCENY